MYTEEAMEQNGQTYERLNQLFLESPVLSLSDDDRYVIFSDLHMGNGGRADDFLSNSDLFLRVAADYYRDLGYSMILNGDVEELQRFSLEAIQKRWEPIYQLFEDLDAEGRLHRIVGNHDYALMDPAYQDHFNVLSAMRFDYYGDSIFVFHGHQTSEFFEKHHNLVRFVLRYFATPLRIKNSEVSHNSEKRFRTEKRVYDFASRSKVLSIIGHTHRPLFESMSKVDSLKFEIERLCRKYPKSGDKKKEKIEARIQDHKEELMRIQQLNGQKASGSSLYRENLVVPCMFNSGSVLGKRGMTALEISGGELSLVHWFDTNRSRKYLRYHNYDTRHLEGTDYYRVTIKRDSLAYIMSRIKLLA
jgi:UDP-2,3-diacylglucosamine pyrophosphatase LpxH